MCRIYVVRKICTISKVNYPLYHLKDETMDSEYQTFFGTKGTKNQSQHDLKNVKLYKTNDPW